MVQIPTGTVTFLFTDIEGSTRLWEQHPEAMQAALGRHDALLRRAIETHGGHVFKTIGDGFCAAFARPEDAVTAAHSAQHALQQEKQTLRVRMAVYTGAAEYRESDYFGPALNRVARLLNAGHGGQVLLSAATATQLPPALLAEIELRSLGVHRLRDIAAREAIFQLLAPGLPAEFPALNTLDVAFRRGLRRAARIAAVIVVVVVSLAVAAMNQARRADQQRRVAEQRQRTLRRYLYAAQMSVAQQDCEAGNVAGARQLLDAQQPDPGQEDLRGFEWRYLWRCCQQHDYLHSFPGPKGGARAAAFSPDDKTLAISSPDGVVKLWDLASRQEITTLARLGAEVDGLAFSSGGKSLTTVSGNNTVEVWNVAKRRLISIHIDRKGGFLNSGGSEMSPDGSIVGADTANRVSLWGVVAQRVLASFPRPKSWMGAVACSPDGRTLAAGTSRHTVELWDVAARRELFVLKGHHSSIWGLAFSPDGKLLASGSDDNTVKLWDVATRQEVGTLLGHRSGIYALAFSPDGRTPGQRQ